MRAILKKQNLQDVVFDTNRLISISPFLIPYSPRPFANPFFRHLRSPNGFHAFSPSLSSYIVSPPHLASFRGGTFVHDLPQCLSGSPFPSDPNETRQPTIRSSVHRVFLSFQPMSHASMHYKYLQISRVCSLFNRRRRRPEDVDTRSRVRQRDKESRTVIRSMPSTRIRFHMCACTRGRCSDRMLSMHHVAAPSHEWILE